MLPDNSQICPEVENSQICPLKIRFSNIAKYKDNIDVILSNVHCDD